MSYVFNERIVIFLLGGLLGAGATGCGGKGHLASAPEGLHPSVETIPDPGVLLQPCIRLAEQGDPSLPRSEGGDCETVAGGGQIFFKNTILLTERKFLSWKRDPLGTGIVNAYFVSQKRDVHNRLKGEMDRRNVSQHKGSGDWFVPLEELTGGEPRSADPTEVHWLTLELHLEGGALVHLRVGLRLAGPLPALGVATEKSEPVAFGEDAGERGWRLGRETYVNPFSRAVKLWFRISGQTLVVRSVLSVVRHAPGPVVNGQLTLHSSRERFQSLVPLKQIKLRVHRSRHLASAGSGDPAAESDVSHASEEHEIHQLGSQAWQSIEVGPLETVEVEWLGHTEPGVRRCSLPPPQERRYRWQTVHEVRRPTREDPGNSYEVTRDHEISRTETWEMEGVGVHGVLRGVTLVTDWAWARDPPEPAALASPAALVPAKDEGLIRVTSLPRDPLFPAWVDLGDLPPPLPAFECQGVF